MGSCICAVFEYSNLYIYLYFLSLAMVKSDQPNIREEVRKRSVWDRVWTAVVVNCIKVKKVRSDLGVPPELRPHHHHRFHRTERN